MLRCVFRTTRGLGYTTNRFTSKYDSPQTLVSQGLEGCLATIGDARQGCVKNTTVAASHRKDGPKRQYHYVSDTA